MFKRTLISAGLVLAGLSSFAADASATVWNRHHPARTEINHRIHREQMRITHEVREGELSRGEARSLRRDLHGVRREERSFARADANHGHLNRWQVRDLNRDLNHDSRRIGR